MQNSSAAIPLPYTLPSYTPVINENGGIWLIETVCAILLFAFLAGIYYQCAERFRSSRTFKLLQALFLYLALLTVMLAVGISTMATPRGAMATFLRAVVRAWLDNGGQACLFGFSTMGIEIANESTQQQQQPQRQQQESGGGQRTNLVTQSSSNNDNHNSSRGVRDGSTVFTAFLQLIPTLVPVPFLGDTHDIPSCDSVIFRADTYTSTTQTRGGSYNKNATSATSTIVVRPLTADDLCQGQSLSIRVQLGHANPVVSTLRLPSCGQTQRAVLRQKQCVIPVHAGSASGGAPSPQGSACATSFEQWCTAGDVAGVLINATSTSGNEQTVSLTCTYNVSRASMCHCVQRGAAPNENQWELNDGSSPESPCRYICNGQEWVPTASLSLPPSSSSSSPATRNKPFTFSVMSVQDPAVQLSLITGGTNVLPTSSWAKYGRLAYGLGVGVTAAFFSIFLLLLLYGEMLCCFRWRRRRHHHHRRRRRRSSNDNPTYSSSALNANGERSAGNNYGTTAIDIIPSGTIASHDLGSRAEEVIDANDDYEVYSTSSSGSAEEEDDERNSTEILAALARQRRAAEEFQAAVQARVALTTTGGNIKERSRHRRGASCTTEIISEQGALAPSSCGGDDNSSGNSSGLAGRCKICFEGTKGIERVRFIPCHHTCCAVCAAKIMGQKISNSNNHSNNNGAETVPCPFCRAPVESTEQCDVDDARTFAASPMSRQMSLGSDLAGGSFSPKDDSDNDYN